MLFRSILTLATGLMSTSLFAQQLEVMVTDSNGAALSDVVVELVLSDAEKANYQLEMDRVVDQLDKEFIPTVTLTTVGSSVSFPNSDDILHHVYSFSPAKNFNIPLYGQSDNNDYSELFPIAGVIEIGCNIHDWMLAYIYVAESSLVAMSDNSGLAVIRDAPSGEFDLRIWHARAADSIEELMQTVSLGEGSVSQLSVQLELQRDRRVRRSPGSSGRRYR